MRRECQHDVRNEYGVDGSEAAGHAAFNDPAISAKDAALFGTALGDQWFDTALAQRLSMSLGVVTAIGVGDARPLKGVATQSANR
ncbi:hypothetical protein WT83_04975 [Burkholderia territorii]|uniref:Uncharacterized protein n=1 Tax=Burkholderia territorii TaxID=1503055 RepID=A0A108F2S2_9BURK|nr:hypothetical protein WT83_04975 [Burkholderia territorii]